jgi:hypothetical protein
LDPTKLHAVRNDSIGDHDDISLSSLESIMEEEEVKQDDEQDIAVDENPCSGESENNQNGHGENHDNAEVQDHAQDVGTATQQPCPRVVDLTQSPKIISERSAAESQSDLDVVRRGLSSQSSTYSTTPSQTSAPMCTKSDNNNDENEIQRLTRIAKKFKRQSLQRAKQYKEKAAANLELSQEIRRMKETTVELKSNHSRLMAKVDALELSLDSKRADILIERRKHGRLQAKCDTLMSEYESISSKYKKLRDCYGKDVEIARGQSMAEVRQIMEENRRLKHQIAVQETKLAKSHFAGRTPSSDSTKNTAKDLRESIRDFDHRIWSQRTLLAGPEGNKERDKAKTNPANNIAKIDSARYSSSATRMFSASSSLQRKERECSKSNATMKEIFGTKRHFMASNAQEPFKQSLTSSAAVTSLSLSQSSKRRKLQRNG